LKRLLNFSNSNILLKIASLNSFSVIVRIGVGFITSKIIALFIGVEGMALIGNLRNFSTSVQTFSTLGLYNGIIKYTAQFKIDVKQLSKSLSTSFYLIFFTTCVISSSMYFYADYINTYIFNTFQFAYIIRIFALALPFYSLNLFLYAILNGYSYYKRYLFINICSQIFGVCITVFLIWNHNIDGALISVVLTPSLILLITLLAVVKYKNNLALIKLKHVTAKMALNLSSYSLMVLISAITVPLIYIAIRNYIIESIDLKAAGYWEAMSRVSSYYLMFVTTLLSLYVLPKYSKINTKEAFRKEVINFYKTIIPLFAIGLIIIYLLRSFVIVIVFSKEFEPVEDLFLWQLLGDFIKALSLVITYQLLAKKMVLEYIIIELFSVVTIYLLSIYYIDIYGVKGATIAHFVSFFLHYCLVLFVFRKTLFFKSLLK